MTADSDDRICVIGAGVSGMVATKVLLEDGFDVDVIEAQSDLGGTWHPDNTYPGLRTNDVRELYRFSDHPYPDAVGEIPTAEQVRAYLHAYADRFDLRQHMQFSTQVRHVERAAPRAGDGEGGFRVTVEPEGEEPDVRHYDKVVVCNGVFCEPNVPDLDGADRFEGEILHSSEVDRGQLEGRRVVVIGGGKSGYDMAVAAAEHASSCAMVFRSAHWLAPRYVLGVRSDWLILTRFVQSFLPYHTKRGAARLLHAYAKPLVDGYWRFLTWFLPRYLDVPDDLEPEVPLPVGLQGIGAGTEIYDEVRAGRVELHRAEIDHVVGGRMIRLDTGTTIAADLVICATGFTQQAEVLSDDLAGLVRDEDGFFTLYRHTLPPRERDLGFVGYASSLGTTLTSEVAAHWLAAHFSGQMTLPSPAAMDREIEEVKRWARRLLPKERSGHVISAYVVDYLDDLLEDMGLPVKREDNWFAEHFGRIFAERYAGLGDERRDVPRLAPARSSHPTAA